MCKGYVLKVKPLLKINTFNKVTGEDLYEEIADLFKQKVSKKQEAKSER